jgi:formylglycine-generating enzyme required for sulfatase activity
VKNKKQVSMNAEDGLHNRIVNLLLPFVQTQTARQELLSASWGPDEPLISYIDFSGASRPFADHLIYKISQYRPQTGQSPIEEVLKQLRYRVGVGQQAEIDNILSWLQRDPRLLSTPAPYKGLEAYEESDAGYFFGRTVLIDKLLTRIANWKQDRHALRFLAIVGASGSGKSSLVKAGLIPALRQSERWQIIVIRPGANPLLSLALPFLPQPQPSTTAIHHLVNELRTHKETLNTLAQLRLAHGWNACDGVLLIVDQFEELFSVEMTGSDKQPAGNDRAAFIHNLLYAAGLPSGSAHLLITLRADFYHHCADYDNLRAALADCQEYIGAMNVTEVQEVITRPLSLAGYQLQKGLTEVILDDLGISGTQSVGDALGVAKGQPEPGFLPLLSHALLQTWEKRQGFTLTLADYHAAGGVKGALRATADAMYAGLSSQEQTLVRAIFGALTEVREGVEDTRRRVYWTELAALIGDEALLKRVIRKLTQARLIVTDQSLSVEPPDATGDFSYAEVAHEALIREWPLLRTWLAEDRLHLQIRRLLSIAAQEWTAHQEDIGYLYRGARLHQVQVWASNPKISLGPQEQAFLSASRRQERASQWQQRGAAIAILVLLVLGGIFIWNTGQRAHWRSQALGMSELVYVAGETVALCPPQGGLILCTPESANATLMTVAPFAIEKYEVSNAQYELCRKAGACSANLFSERYGQAHYQDYPVQGVGALQASAYCHWLGRQLPTEVQWELALGDNPPDFAPFHDLSPVIQPVHQTTSGIVNLLGNVTEWTRSYAQSNPDAYQEVLWDGTVESLSFTSFLIMRGGSWLDSSKRDPVDHRTANEPFGFRCVTHNN